MTPISADAPISTFETIAMSKPIYASKAHKSITTINDTICITVFILPKMFAGMNKAYEIVHAKDFPMIKFGTKILIIKDKIEEWLENNIGNSF